MPYAIGVDLGGTNIKMVAVTTGGQQLSQTQEPSEDNAAAWVERIKTQIARCVEEYGEPAACVGLAAPGLAARDGRSIAWMQGRLGAVQGLDWTEALGAPQTVPVLNDAHAALLSEVWLGAAAGSRNALLLTLGTGVGGGALVDGRLLRGHIGRAGHLGHISLNPDGAKDITGTPGSLEDAIGECTLAARTQGRFAITAELVKAHRAGDAEASAVWLCSVKALACGLVSLINAFDPEVVILGGGIAKSGDALFTPLERHLDAWEWRPTGGRTRIVPAMLGEWAGAVGAAYHALRLEKT